MASKQEKKSHIVCVPLPFQGHINPMLKLAKILHSKGFHITFVNTEFNHRRLLKSQGCATLSNLPTFRFETIPDGLPPSENPDASQEIPSLIKSVEENCLGPFKSLLSAVSVSYSLVTCIVADFGMGFTLAAAREFDIPEILLWTSGTGSLICFHQYPNLLEKGLMPIKDLSFLTNGYLDTVVDCIPSMSGIRLKDIPPFIQMIYPDDEYIVQFLCTQVERAKTACAIIFNTFQELESDILSALSSMFPPCYEIGPLHLLEEKIGDKSLATMRSNLWKEEYECLNWLDSKAPLSVVYVNFGSIAMMTPEQLVEFCRGLAKSNYPFLWILRPDLVIGDSVALPPDFLAETSNRGMMVGWCPQEQVLSHPSIGGFLTHSGWNSIVESISNGVPMICWPFLADQLTNCWLSCKKWGVALETDKNAKSDEIKEQIIELMSGEKGNVMRENAISLKNKATKACTFPSGSSMASLDKLVQLLQTYSK